MEYGATVRDPYQKYNSDKMRGCSVELLGSSKVGIRDTLVFLICLMCWGGRLFSKETRLILFYNIINGLHKCPSKASLSRRI